MPQFIYTGQGSSISIAGRHVDRGIATTLEGRAADIASTHPDFEQVGGSKAGDAKTAGSSKVAAKPAASRSTTRKATVVKETTKRAPAKAEPSTPIVSSDDPTPASTEIDPNDI